MSMHCHWKKMHVLEWQNLWGIREQETPSQYNRSGTFLQRRMEKYSQIKMCQDDKLLSKQTVL